MIFSFSQKKIEDEQNLRLVTKPTKLTWADWRCIAQKEILHSKNPKFDLRVREALYIRRYQCGPGKGMNQDYGSYVYTNQWQPVFNRTG